MFEILTPGQKLKKLRKELSLTQAQLASGTISREFISMVEHDVRRLSADNALSLMDRFRQITEEQNIPFKFPMDFLSISAEQEFYRYIKEIDYKNTAIDSMEALLQQAIELNHLESQCTLLKSLGVKYFHSDFDQAFLYFTKAKEILATLKDSSEITKLNNNLGALCQVHNKLHEAVVYLEMALSSENHHLTEQEEISITLNLALLYSKLHWHDKCLKLINADLETAYLNKLTDDKINLLILRAVSLAEAGRPESGLELIRKLERISLQSSSAITYIRSNKVYILSKIDIDLAIKEQQNVVSLNITGDLAVQNFSLLGDLFYTKGDLSQSLGFHQRAMKHINEETYPELQLDIHRKVILDLQTLGQLSQENILPVIRFCQDHKFKNELLQFGILYLSLGANLSDDDSRILGILNTCFDKEK